MTLLFNPLIQSAHHDYYISNVVKLPGRIPGRRVRLHAAAPMPELPEVEAQRMLLSKHIVGLRIGALVASEQGGGPRNGEFDDKVFSEGVSCEQVSNALQGRWIRSACRKGKQLWLELSDEGVGGKTSACLLLHFGMTGACVIQGVEAPSYKSFSINLSEWPPRFTKLELSLVNALGEVQNTLAYTDPRRFGRILLRGADPSTLAPLSQLAADPLTDPPTAAEFSAKLQKWSAPIKAVLLDQSKVVCGVGNWVADETLYQAGVLPAAVCRELSEAQRLAVHEAMLRVCREACSHNADSSRFPQARALAFRLSFLLAFSWLSLHFLLAFAQLSLSCLPPP